MNAQICGALATLLAVAGCALSFALIYTNAFVEVFVSDGNGNLSCKIGFLGVFEAGFDPTCGLSDSQLVASNLGFIDSEGEQNYLIQPFEAATTEFKLLFPTQENFMREVNFLYGLTKSCADDDTDPNQVQCQLGLSVFPEFDGDCEKYWAASSGQITAFDQAQPGLDRRVYGGFVQGAAEQVLGLYYNGFTVGSLSSAVGGTIASAYLAASLDPTTPVVSPVFDAVVDGLIAQINNSASVLSVAVLPALKVHAAANCAALRVDECVNAVLSETNIAGSLFSTTTFGTQFCATYGIPTATCGLSSSNGAYTLVEGFFSVADTLSVLSAGQSPQIEGLKQLVQGLAGMFSIITTGQLSIPGIATPFSFSTNASNYLALDSAEAIGAQLASEIVPFEYGATFDSFYEPCEFMNVFQQLETFNPVPGTCSLREIMASSIGIATAAGAAPEDLSLLSGIDTLFKTCEGALLQLSGGLIPPNPNDCWPFFASYFVSAVFQDSEMLAAISLPEGFIGTSPAFNTGVFDLAREECEDDKLDASAIETAQTLGPIGAGVIAVGAVVGLVATLTAKKGLASLAGVACLAGVALLLVSLLGVYNAPIYQAVAESGEEEPVLGEVLYISGDSLIYGLAGIGLSAVAGISFFVYEFLNCRGAEDKQSIKGAPAVVASKV